MKMKLLSCVPVFLGIIVSVASLDFIHHDQTALATFLVNISTQFPNITKLYSVGQSVEGVDLWVLAIGKDIDSYVELRPHVKYVGNMHGNEVISREVLLHLIELYVTGYATNTSIKSFLDTTVVHIMPTMNPDGYNISQEGDCMGVQGRYNKDGIDLNRNFPDIWHDRHQKPIAVETQHVIEWLSEYNFVLSANLHGGALVANFPFDQYEDLSQTSGPALGPDDDIFRHLALLYATTHPTMAATNGSECEGDFFLDGITNGADWYPVAGGMQDYNYLLYGIYEITLEVSCCKFPNGSDIMSLWEANKDPLVEYLMEVHRGVKGIITDVNNNSIIGAQLYIEGRESVPFTSKLYGEYYRVLLPGQYTLKVSADKYNSTSSQFTVTAGVTRLDVQLQLAPNPTSGVTPLHQGILLFKGALVVLSVLFMS